MNENVKTPCVCELGCDKGVFKKTIENNVFTIYGNISQNSYIIIRYHGELIDNIDYENYSDNLYISYFFDENKQETRTVSLAKCTKCIGENYCALIELGEHESLTFEFNSVDAAAEHSELQEKMLFSLEIKRDLLTDVLQKYGIEENV